MIIAICGLKGGVGKTTTTLALASALSRAGRTPLLLDLDPGASLGLWSRTARESGSRTPVTLAVRGPLLDPEQIRALGRGFSATLLDAPAQLTRPTATAMAAADLVLLPCSPDAPDVWALGRTLEVVARVRRGGATGPRVLAVPVRHDVRRRGDLARLRQTLAECGLDTTSATLPLRAVHPRALARGVCLHDEDPRDPACAEADALAHEVADRLRVPAWHGAEVRH